MDKRIIVDCDGVLLDWCYAFDVWMSEQGYNKIPNRQSSYDQSYRNRIPKEQANRQIRNFNESGCVWFIPAYKDSVEYVNKLYDIGWRFEVVSCLDRDKYAQGL